ncbi:hypothetical protein LPJ72_003738 [Coemansia sp. Benny D160-2]|nr:hypothetical protein LPJ72_003738 [Coemansia sp. Benny D160-2]
MNSLTRRLLPILPPPPMRAISWSKHTLQKPLLTARIKGAAYSTQDETEAYLETAKKQLREYQDWRRHFRWSPEMVRQILRDYSLWSVLALLAYYNLNKRQEREAYDAETFVLIDDLREKIYRLDPYNRTLKDSIWEHKRQEEEKQKEEEEKERKRASEDASNSSGGDGRKRGTAVMF